MYDHNQTLVPDSFMTLHVRHGRPLLERKEMESRHEAAELLAQQIAEVVASVPDDDAAAQREALLSVKASLLAGLLEGQEGEATWVVSRAAEICGWAPHEGPSGPPRDAG